MSLIYNNYKDKVDKCWYDSTNIIFSECIDYENELKDLKVVFKGGRYYLYKNVDVNDYLLFRTDISQGKALSKYITPKYTGVRLPDVNIEDLTNEMKLLIEEKENNTILVDDKKNAIYHIKLDSETNEIELYINNNLIFEGINGTLDLFEIISLLGIKCSSENFKKEK